MARKNMLIIELMDTYMYNEGGVNIPQYKVDQFNDNLRHFLEQQTFDELEGGRRDWLNDTVDQMWNEFCEEEKEMKMLYAQDGDCWLYEAQSNGLNFLILEEEYRGRHIIFNWDVSEEEVNAITEKFLGVGLTEDDFQNDAKWEYGDFREKHRFIYYNVLA